MTKDKETVKAGYYTYHPMTMRSGVIMTRRN